MLTVERISDLAGFLKTQPFWDSLLAESEEMDSPFLTFDWIRLWWRIFGDNRQLFVLVLKQDGIPAAVVPLMRSLMSWRGLPVLTLSTLTNAQSSRSGILPGRPEGAGDAVTAMFRYLRDTRTRFDLLRMEYLPAGSPVTRQLDSILPSSGLGYRTLSTMLSPYLRINGTWDEYLQSRSRNLREKIRRTASGITREGRHKLSLITSGDMRDTMAKILAVSRATWKYKKKTALANNAASAEFFRRYAEHAANRRQLKIMLLEYAGRPIAFTYELKYRNRDYFIKTGFDETFARLSPGIFILSASLQEAFASGCAEYDLLGSNEGYKTRFTELIRPHCTYWIFNGGIYGRLLRTVEMNAVPFLKRLLGKERGDAEGLTQLPAHSPRAVP